MSSPPMSMQIVLYRVFEQIAGGSCCAMQLASIGHNMSVANTAHCLGIQAHVIARLADLPAWRRSNYHEHDVSCVETC